jgi:hypothetical protein
MLRSGALRPRLAPANQAASGEYASSHQSHGRSAWRGRVKRKCGRQAWSIRMFSRIMRPTPSTDRNERLMGSAFAAQIRLSDDPVAVVRTKIGVYLLEYFGYISPAFSRCKIANFIDTSKFAQRLVACIPTSPRKSQNPILPFKKYPRPCHDLYFNSLSVCF